VTSSVEESPFRRFHGLEREKRTVEILRGDFTRIRGSLDLPEVRESYSASVEKLKVQKSRVVDPSPSGPLD
jgi:hypothetical protein